MSKAIAFLLAATSLPLAGQWLDYRDPRTPRTRDGQPNLTAPAPRLDGKPDLTGLWQMERTPDSEFARVLGDGYSTLQVDTRDITKNVASVFWGMKPDEEPLRPEAASILKHRLQNQLERPITQCLPGGIPLAMLIFTFKMIQSPQEIVMLPESGDPPRQIYTDGRSLPKDPEPTRWGTQLASGRVIRWWSKQQASTTGRGSTHSATRAANPCGSRSGITAAISATWIWRSLSTIPSTTRVPSPSRQESS